MLTLTRQIFGFCIVFEIIRFVVNSLAERGCFHANYSETHAKKNLAILSPLGAQYSPTPTACAFLLNVAIRVLDLAKDSSGDASAKVTFGAVSALLTTIRVRCGQDDLNWSMYETISQLVKRSSVKDVWEHGFYQPLGSVLGGPDHISRRSGLRSAYSTPS